MKLLKLLSDTHPHLLFCFHCVSMKGMNLYRLRVPQAIVFCSLVSCFRGQIVYTQRWIHSYPRRIHSYTALDTQLYRAGYTVTQHRIHNYIAGYSYIAGSQLHRRIQSYIALDTVTSLRYTDPTVLDDDTVGPSATSYSKSMCQGYC